MNIHRWEDNSGRNYLPKSRKNFILKPRWEDEYDDDNEDNTIESQVKAQTAKTWQEFHQT